MNKKYQCGYIELMASEIKDFKLEITTDWGCPEIVMNKKEAFKNAKECAEENNAKVKVYKIILEEVNK
jgi:hypothetical protein